MGKVMGTHANAQTGITAIGLFRMRCAEPYAQSILFRGPVREWANILDKQARQREKEERVLLFLR